jgi:hypothetical protein
MMRILFSAGFLFLLFTTGCGNGGSEPEATEPAGVATPVDTDEPTADPAAVLSGGIADIGLREELDALVAAQSGLLGELAVRVGDGELTPAQADEEHRAWLAERAVELGLEIADLERLLGGWVGGRFRRGVGG